MTKKLLTLISILLAFNSNGQNQEFPREINLVFDYLLNVDFPEIFNNKSYQFRPVNWQIIDIDNDGNVEVFLQTYPHYTQSPTITIFKINKNDSVTRIIEGLAPGHLIPLSDKDDYFSPHSTGTAIDAQLDKNEPEKLLKFANASLKFGMSCVLYKNFIHTDKKDSNTFLDLTYLNDYSNENTCEQFQFSMPEEIIAGKVKRAANKFFVAKIGDEFFCYEIKGFENNVNIKKTISIIKVPLNFKKFAIDDGYIKYLTDKDKLIDFKF